MFLHWLTHVEHKAEAFKIKIIQDECRQFLLNLCKLILVINQFDAQIIVL